MTMISGADGVDIANFGVQPKITVEGTVLPDIELSSLLSMEVETSIGRPDLCELRLVQEMDPQGTPGDDIAPKWAPGKKLKIEVGTKVLFDGEMTSIDFAGGTAESTELIVLAFDKRHRLYRNEIVKVFKDSSWKDVVAGLCGQVGVQHDLSGLPTDKMPYYLHQGTVGDLVDRLCAEYGLYCVGDAGKLVIKKGSELTVAAGKIQPALQILEYRLRQTSTADRSAAEVRGWDPKQKKEFLGTANRSAALPGNGSPEATDSQTPFGAQKLLHFAPVTSQTEAQTRALGLLTGNLDAAMQLDATTTLLPDAAAGKIIELEGVPQRFAGKYRLTSVRHRYDSEDGGRSFLVCRGADDTTITGLLGQAVLGGTPLASTPRDPGLRPALVTNVKSNPNEGAFGSEGAAGEVKVKMPWIGDSIESGWLRVVTVGGGNDRGFFVMPEVGDEVLVAFDDGDMRSGYVLGGLYNGNDVAPRKQALLTDGSKIQERVWRSRTGHEIVLGDKQGEEYVQINTKDSGMVVRLDVKEKLIKITGEDVTIENTGKITIKSTGEISVKSDGDLKMEAMNVTLKAQQKVTIEGGTQVSINGQAGAELKGAKVDVTAQGPATVKGNPIMLN